MKFRPTPFFAFGVIFLFATTLFAQPVDPMEATTGWKPYNPTVEGRLAAKGGELLVTIPYQNGKRDTYVLYKNYALDFKPGAVLSFPAFIPAKSFLTLEVYIDDKGKRVFSYKPGEDRTEIIDIPLEGAKLTKLTFSFSEPAGQIDTGDEERTFRLGKISLKGNGGATAGSPAPAAKGPEATQTAGQFSPSGKPQPTPLPGPNILVEGNFEKMKKDFAEGWAMAGYCWDTHRPNRVTVEAEPGNRFARLFSGLNFDKGAVWVVADPLPLMAHWKTLKVSLLDRVVNFKQGPESWNNVRIEAAWRDAMNKEMKTYKAFPLPLEATWRESTHEFSIPPGAAAVQFKIGFWASMGTADIDDVRVVGE